MTDFDETIGKARPVSVSAFGFHGNWVSFMKIAVPNLVLTIVTLGIYRFWGTTRERQYLWSQTQFIDEKLEWTGTGMELFVGFIMVFFLIGIPFAIIQLVAQGAIFQGEPVVAGVLTFVMFMALFYLTGVAYFRAMRYRLSRTYWRGIRGGTDDPGFHYGVSYVWKHTVAAIPLFLLYPWASISLWNERWNAMSFGPYRFEANAQWTKLMKRYALFYLAPFLLLLVGIYAAVQEQRGGIGAGGIAAMGGFVVLIIIAIYIVMPLAALLYYSKFLRVGVGGLRIGELEFEFKARSPDWILFFLANWLIWGLAAGFAIAPISVIMDDGLSPEVLGGALSAALIGTIALSAAIGVVLLGLASALIRYRSWKFFVTHMEAYGEVNLDRMSQSETVVSGHGEGLLDAFDVGAI